ncbi:GNAT family N-acetyltransferase [Streptomyces sp. NPDC019890]|uniref:GNAT family N-acetyltransferase n=1 Tax=Streptomyces sp. NPDC019890 TaxID=3365064 RepID=UPI0038516132
MLSSVITSGWVEGWAVSRGTPAPVPQPWGYRIDVGLPDHVFRHVLAEPDEAIVRKLGEAITEPGAWLKLLAPPETVADWLPEGWSLPDDPGFMMFTELRRHAPGAVPDGYTLHKETRDGVLRVRVHAADGSLATRGQVAPTGATAVVDQMETEPAHQRRGLGRLVMRTLESAAAEAGATTGILSATTQGRALYGSLGWQLQGPLTGIVRDPAV